MSRHVTLFTGQWADLPIAELAPKSKEMGFDGLELACWGDHFDVQKALHEADYVEKKWGQLEANGLSCFSISNHLVGQAVCDHIDERHKAILSPEIWGDGDPEGVRQRAAQEMIDTAKAARKFFDAKPGGAPDRVVVNGFTGSSIWHLLYSFPPVVPGQIDAGFEDFAKRWKPIMDAFDKEDVYYGLEVHPTEIAFDIASAARALEAIGHHKRFGFNYDPSHLGYQGVDYIKFIYEFRDRIFHAHVKDAWWGHSNGDVGVFGGHVDFGDYRRYWDFRSPGRGDVNFEEVIVALNDIGYQGPLSIEWEDSRMDRFAGGAEAAAFTRKMDFSPSDVAFDAAFDKEKQ
ncbi:MAG TPA: sugar phosphate isomerase/epimerase family protein [Opitutales bacterium]|nr:sugar phosphate isomerase/epimerase family protein [Opitutales bacterium]